MVSKNCVFATLIALASGLPAVDSAAQTTTPMAAMTAQRIDQVFAEYAKPGSPGCALALVDKDRMVYEKGYGLASIELGVVIDPAKTVFDVGSISKQFTAASILLLLNEHKLSLDDDIRTYVPELPDYGTTVTLRHLLHHTSGIADYPTLIALKDPYEEDVSTDVDALRVLSRHPLDFTPGSEFSYSNSGYFLLSRVVKRITGQPLREFAQQRLFAPLGMTHTRIVDDHSAIVADKAEGYDGTDGTFVRLMSNGEQTGDAGVQTTLEDLATWDRNFYDGKVGGNWMIEQLQTRGRLNDGQTIPYARGIVVDSYRGLRAVAHSGSRAGFKAYFLRFPGQRVSAIALCNVASAQPGRLLRAVADIYLADFLAPVAAAKPMRADDAGKHAGLYVDATRGMVRRISVRDAHTWYFRGEGEESELTALGHGRFAVTGATTTVSFASTPKGRPRRMTVENDGKLSAATESRMTVAQLEEVRPVTPNLEALSASEGTYASVELETQWSLAVADGQLAVLLKGGLRLPLQAAFADAFLLPGGLLQLERDEQGRVRGFTVNFPDARNLKFVRVQTPG